MQNYLPLVLANSALTVVFVVGLIIVGIIGLVLFALVAQFIGLWVQAIAAGAKVSIIDLVGMRLRKVDPRVIV